MKINAKKIQYLMDCQPITQRGLADHAGVAPMTINKLLKNGTCSCSTASKIAAALGVNVADFVRGAE